MEYEHSHECSHTHEAHQDHNLHEKLGAVCCMGACSHPEHQVVDMMAHYSELLQRNQMGILDPDNEDDEEEDEDEE